MLDTDFIRVDIETRLGYSSIIDKCKKMMKEQGRDFNREFRVYMIDKILNEKPFATNQEIADELGISKRQVSKIRNQKRQAWRKYS